MKPSRPSEPQSSKPEDPGRLPRTPGPGLRRQRRANRQRPGRSWPGAAVVVAAKTLGLVLGALALACILIVATNPGVRDSSPGWRRLADMPRPRSESAGALVGGKIWVAGGLAGAGWAVRYVDYYDLTTSKWAHGPDLPEPRHHAAATAVGNRIYLTGGGRSALDWTPQRNLWILDPNSGGWRKGPDLPEGRLGHGAVYTAGKLWIVGGSGGDATLVLDPRTDTWTAGPPIPHPRDHLGVVSESGRIYAIGGRHGATSTLVERLDPPTGIWEELTPLPVATSGAAVAVAGTRILVAGGENPSLVGGGVRSELQVYDVRTGSWELGSPMLVRAHGAAAVGTGERMVVAGGSRRQGALTPLGYTGAVQSIG